MCYSLSPGNWIKNLSVGGASADHRGNYCLIWGAVDFCLEILSSSVGTMLHLDTFLFTPPTGSVETQSQSGVSAGYRARGGQVVEPTASALPHCHHHQRFGPKLVVYCYSFLCLAEDWEWPSIILNTAISAFERAEPSCTLGLIWLKWWWLFL